MKNIQYIITFIFITFILGCSNEEENFDYLNSIDKPNNISALFTIASDNSGKVTIQPNGEGVTLYKINFGDNSNQIAEILPGAKIDHVYSEGEYNVKITAVTLDGKTTEYTQPLTVTFVAPTNLQVTANVENGNPYKLNVSAKANFETYFEVFFGEAANEIPVQFNEGQTISHTYSSIGNYTLKVIAYSGGVAKTESTQQISIFDPLLLPVNFESPTLNYNFINFGGANSVVVNNPSLSAVNSSTKVGRLTKSVGAEIWAGSLLQLDQPIDFSVLKKIRIKSYSPKVGAVIKLKLENLNDGNISHEIDAVTTVANDWENLIFDFSAINTANTYQKVVVFYDFGVNGTGADYYFDDIRQTNQSAQVELPLTFQDASLTYSFVNFGGASGSVVNNPSSTGINTSSKVGQFNKGSGSETWAGTFIELAEPIDFTNLQKVKMKIWSPQAGIPVLFKLENSTNGAINVERIVNTTVANTWEELTFDLTGIVSSNNYQKVVVFFNFGTSGTGENYYFDDIKLSN